ncbi:sigma-70 family RNA polymerase sigma factor [Haloferula sp.]|uniref:sigma-70 family RNA polymerase sigma factor n=1 Tax=Haloferula sp. TaxID=2497595 RepID=UPI0032A10F30
MSTDPKKAQEFVALLTNNQEAIRTYIISQVPGSPDVRDILQEVNIVLWENMSQFELGTNFCAWARKVAFYQILNHRKKMKRNGFVVFDEELTKTLAAEIEDHGPGALEAKRDALKVCLSKLSADNRDLLEARYRSTRGDLEELSTKIGRSRASLRVSLVRVRASLKRCIESRLAVEGVRS